MVRLISIVYIVLLSWWQAKEATGFPIAIALEAIAMGYQIFLAAEQFRELLKLEDSLDVESNEHAALFTGLEKIDNHISELHDELTDLLNELDLKEISEKMRKIHQVVDYVNRTYNNFLDLTQEPDCLVRSKLENMFVKDVLGFDFHNLDSLIVEMHDNFIKVGGAKKDSLAALISGDKSHLLMCNRAQSNQHTLFQIYKSIVNTDLKALALRLAAWEILKKDAEENKSDKLTEENEYKKFEKRINDLATAVSPLVDNALRVMWRCDRDNFIEGKTHSKLQQIFQAVILNEEDTNEDTCSYSSCPQMQKLKYRPNGQQARDLPCKLHCDGYITDCVNTLDIDKNLDYCAAPESDDRRYLGLKYDDNTFYGEKFDKKSCRRRFGQFQGRRVWFNDCKYCLCTCVSKKIEVDRYFSLNEVTTVTQKHMVITGVRLRLENHIFYIDIREGQLGKNGTIIPGTTKWKKGSPDDKVDFETIIAEGKGGFDILPTNDDVYAVQWEQKTVYLDDIEDKTGDKVLTGIKFFHEGKALKLLVRLSTYDYKTGTVYDQHVWRDNKQTVASRGLVEIADGQHPLRRNKDGKAIKNTAMSRTGSYVEFTTTSRAKNLGQFTVPFIDTQEVAPEPPTPLSGAGFYHRGMGMRESGGLLGLKVFQLTVAPENNR